MTLSMRKRKAQPHRVTETRALSILQATRGHPVPMAWSLALPYPSYGRLAHPSEPVRCRLVQEPSMILLLQPQDALLGAHFGTHGSR